MQFTYNNLNALKSPTGPQSLLFGAPLSSSFAHYISREENGFEDIFLSEWDSLKGG
jgi:hypothetical protein